MSYKNKMYAQVRNELLRWFHANKRDLPWRKDYSPYIVWISEIMLQQTQVRTALPYFHRWMDRFPDVLSVASAQEDELLKLWEGMGYYSRVRNIHRTAKILVRDFGGVFPRDHEKLLSLPGIGPYTAGAIMSFAFNEEYPLVDVNIERVLARVLNIDKPVRAKESRDLIWRTAGEMIPPGSSRHFNQALMELGAVICVPRNPACLQCPIANCCESYRAKVVALRPVNGKRKVTTPIDVAVGLLVHDGKILIQKRPASGLMPNLWEFPGGKVIEGETPAQALVREFFEELEIRVCCLDKVALIRHSYTSYKVSLHAYFCEFQDHYQSPVLHSAVDARWVLLEELDLYTFPAANRKLIELL